MNFQNKLLNYTLFSFLYLGIFCLNIEFSFAQSGSDAPEMEEFKAEVDPNPPPEKSQDEIKSMFEPLRITLNMGLDIEEYQSRHESLKQVKIYSAQWVTYVEQQNKDLLKAQKKKYLLDKEYRKNRTETVAAYKEEHKYMVEEKKYTEEISAQKNVKKDAKKEVVKSKKEKKREAEDLKLKKKYAADPIKLKEKQDELQLKRDAENEKKKEKDGFALEKFNQRKKNNPLVVQEKIDNLDKSFDKVVDSLDSQYERRNRDITEQIKQLEEENAEEMKRFQEIQELDYDIRLSMGLATKGIADIHSQSAKKVTQMLDGLTVSKFYDEELDQIVNQPFLDELVENIFYTDRKIDVESVSISRLISNYEKYDIEGKQGAVGFRINLDKDYVLMLLHLQLDGKKALLFRKTDIKEENDQIKEQEISRREQIKAEYEIWLAKRNQEHEIQIESLTAQYDSVSADLFEEENPALLFDKITQYILLRRAVKQRRELILADNSSEEKLGRLVILATSIRESMTYASGQIAKIENERQKDINRTLSEINNKLVGTQTSDIYDVETGKFTDIEFINLLKETMFFSSSAPNIETSMISRIVPNPRKWGINPLSPATGYRINLDNEYDLLILKLESGETKAVMLKRQELAIISTLEKDALAMHLAQNAENKTTGEKIVEQNLRDLNQRLTNLVLSEIYDTETEEFTDTEFIEKLKANIFYSRTETNISTSGIGKIVSNAEKYGMNPLLAAKGYRFNIDATYDLLVIELENGQIEALVLARNELATISTVERDELDLHLAQNAQAHDEREQEIEENLQDLNQRLANLVLSEIYDTETDEFTDTEFIEKLKANIFYSQTKENINTSGLGRIVPNAEKYGMNPKMAAKGYRFNIDPKHDLMVLKLENNHIQALIHQRNELEQTSTLQRDELHLHLAKKAQAKTEGEQAIEQNLQEISKEFRHLELEDIYNEQEDRFINTEFIEKLKANIFYSQAKENIHTSGVGSIVPNAEKYGMNPKMAAKGYRFNIDPKHDLMVLKLENHKIYAVIHQRNELEEKQFAQSVSYWNIDEHYLAQKQDSSNRAFLIEAKGIHQSLELDKTDSLDLDKFEAKINDLSLLQHQLKKKITANNQSVWAMPSVKPLDSLRNVISQQINKASKELSTLQNQRTHRAETYLNAKFELSKIYNEEKKEFVDLDYLKEFGNAVFYSKKSPSIETTGLGKVIPDVAYYGVNPKIRAIGHRININPNYDLIIVKLETGTKYAIIWNKITFKTLDAWNLNL